VNFSQEATMSAIEFKQRELAHRSSNGIEVSLFWTKVGNILTVEVLDTKADEFFVLEVPSDRAMDAFHHPYAYRAAASRALEAADYGVAA
jgi:hypothetical protein